MHACDMDALCTRLRELAPLAVALSGGLDSRFLAHAARLASCDTVLLHASGPHINPRESAQTKLWAAGQGLPLRIVSFDPLLLPAVAENTQERCYFCKKALLETLRPYASGYALCDGTQADDLAHPHRPGLRALKEAGLYSPLAETGFGKTQIRELAAASGLTRPEQPARPCLLTRLAYGLRPEAGVLARLAAAETELEDSGLSDFRLRLTPAPQLHVLALPEDMPTSIMRILARHGFAEARLVHVESLSGFFDRVQLRVKGWTS
ncbi:MAG: ATP-dependent sacrificial sulfur transferase LarE [Betaproteobacteria bacterium]|nr:ATP-dependent sacrificial sulfur transferase LarE [Betaproteobacteria bacterium]